MARKLYVGNLPYQTVEQDLTELFASAGAVESVNVMRDMATGRARGFAFVEMATDEDAQKAIDALNNYSYGGRNLTVNEARPKPQSFGGGVAATAVAAATAVGAPSPAGNSYRVRQNGGTLRVPPFCLSRTRERVRRRSLRRRGRAAARIFATALVSIWRTRSRVSDRRRPISSSVYSRSVPEPVAQPDDLPLAGVQRRHRPLHFIGHLAADRRVLRRTRRHVLDESASRVSSESPTGASSDAG